MVREVVKGIYEVEINYFKIIVYIRGGGQEDYCIAGGCVDNT